MNGGTGRAVDSGSAAFDVAVIGAGVVGCAIARELAGHELSVALLDAHDDVGQGTSKANSAILHTGYDAVPGSLEGRLVARGHALLSAWARATGIAAEQTGALLVAWTPEELAALPALRDKSLRNGYRAARLVGPEEIRRQVPALAPGALGALTVPDESVVCPWSTTLALATDAVSRGVRLLLGHRVTGVRRAGDGSTALATSRGGLTARWTVNAAGLGADTLDGRFGHRRFTVTPRRGQLIVYDKPARPLASRIVLPVPSALGKGVLISPTVYGNVLLGPTAENLTDRADTATTAAGLDFLRARGERLIPALAGEEITAAYAGLRAATDREDYLIEADPERRYLLVGGIRSTGLSASLAIGEHARDLLADAGLPLRPRRRLPDPPAVPQLGEAFWRPYQDAELIARDRAYGRVVCYCERVTEGEIRDAFRGPLPPPGLPGLRRRTRAMNGRCQGHACGARVTALYQRLGAPPSGESR